MNTGRGRISELTEAFELRQRTGCTWTAGDVTWLTKVLHEFASAAEEARDRIILDARHSTVDWIKSLPWWARLFKKFK